MKSYEEMSHDVFERINEYENEQKRKKKIAAKTAAAFCPALILTAAGVAIWKNGAMVPPDNSFTNNAVVELTTDSPTENGTKSAVTSAKTDSYTSVDTTGAVYADNKVIAEISGNDTVDAADDENSVSDETAPSIEEHIPAATDAPVIQPATEYTPAQSTAPPVNAGNGGGYIGDMLGFAYINGELFMQPFDWYEIRGNYTLGEFIGMTSEFDSNYKYNSGFSFYYSAEDKNVVLVTSGDGSDMPLVKTVLPDGEKIAMPEPNNWVCY